MRYQKGLTLIELAVTIIMVALLSAFSILTFTDMMETGDATLVQSTQAVLQTTLTQAANRLDVTPLTLSQGTGGFNGNNVVNACRLNVPQRATLSWLGGINYRVNIATQNRSANFLVTNTGDVVVQSISGFQKYTVANGVIKKI